MADGFLMASLTTTGPTELIERLQRRIEDLEQFAAYTAHELKNPLQALVVSSEALLADAGMAMVDERGGTVSGLDLDDLVSKLGDLNDEARRLSAQVTDLVTVMTEGEAELATQPVDLVALVHSVVAGYRIDLDDVGGSVEVTGGDTVVTTDPTMVATIVSNLVSNAVRYRCPERPLRIRVDVGARTGETGRPEAVVTVADNGRGIRPGDQNRIFAPLSRVDRSIPGHGIGLALARRLADRLNGDLTVESEFGVGSRFQLSLHSD